MMDHPPEGGFAGESLMVQPISANQLKVLQFVGKHPGVDKEQLMKLAKATDEDLAYLETHDMIRQREAGHYRIAHFGELVLRRS